MHSKTSIYAGLVALAALATGSPLEVRDVDSTDIPCFPTTSKSTVLAGNGDPHQNFIFKQVSGTTDCTNNPLGSASIDQSHSVSWGVDGEISPIGFISGGFDVSEEYTTGFTNSFGCTKANGKTYKGDLCVFERIQTTAYTVEVRTCVENSCSGTFCHNGGPKSVIYAPNSDQNDCYYSNKQLNLPCKAPGAEHHVNRGPKGGPHFISCEPTRA